MYNWAVYWIDENFIQTWPWMNLKQGWMSLCQNGCHSFYGCREADCHHIKQWHSKNGERGPTGGEKGLAGGWGTMNIHREKGSGGTPRLSESHLGNGPPSYKPLCPPSPPTDSPTSVSLLLCHCTCTLFTELGVGFFRMAHQGLKTS